MSLLMTAILPVSLAADPKGKFMWRVWFQLTDLLWMRVSRIAWRWMHLVCAGICGQGGGWRQAEDICHGGAERINEQGSRGHLSYYHSAPSPALSGSGPTGRLTEKQMTACRCPVTARDRGNGATLTAETAFKHTPATASHPPRVLCPHGDAGLSPIQLGSEKK